MGKKNPQGRLWVVLEMTERREIQAALLKHSGNVRMAAEYLGIDRSQLYKRLAALGIDKEEYRDGTGTVVQPPAADTTPAQDDAGNDNLPDWMLQAAHRGEQ